MKNSFFVLIFSGLIFISFIYYQLPGVIATPNESSQKVIFLDRHGLEIKSYAPGETYDWLESEELPDEFLKLLLLAEDKNFYAHFGVDFSAALRSLYLNLKEGRRISGASTITQQMYRLYHHLPRTLWGKVQTVLGAVKIEQKYSKEQIFSFYINTLPFGRNILGVRQAAEVYFEKEIHLLSLGEMATLAVLPRAPSALLASPKALLKRRNELLDSFYERYGKEWGSVENEKSLKLEIKYSVSSWQNYHFISQLLLQPDLGEYVSSSGRVSTTLDIYLQENVKRILANHVADLKSFEVNNGAVLVLDNRNGDVLSYVGSTGISEGTGSHFDGLKERRQPGSALKPLTYALSLQKGRRLSDPLPDIPSYYKTGLGQYLPRNYDQGFTGPRLMRESLANSLNLPAVALADELGANELHRFYTGFGLHLPEAPSHYGVGLTLGNAELTPLELASAYSAFARGGKRVELKFFKSAPLKTMETPLDKDVAFLIADVLDDEVARSEEFGERNVFDLPFSFSVKTGTSTDFRDNWAVGFSPHYTIVVWVGNMNQKPMRHVTGTSGAGPILAEVAKVLHKGSFPAKFKMPGTIESHSICALSGKLPGPHCIHKKTELFIKDSAPKEICEFHREVIVHDCQESGDQAKIKVAILPDKYQAFTEARPEWSLDYQVAGTCQNTEFEIAYVPPQNESLVRIGRPLSGSIFAIDPNIPRKMQKLRMEINRFHKVKKVEWITGSKKFEGNGPSVDWPMEKGKHEFKGRVHFENGKVEETDVIEVTVL